MKKTILFLSIAFLYLFVICIFHSNSFAIQTYLKAKFATKLGSPKVWTIDKIENKPLSNTVYQYQAKILAIDDTELIKNKNRLCNPKIYGYNQQKGKIIFPDQSYPDCSVYSGISESMIYIDKEKEITYMTCPNNGGKFAYGPYLHISLIEFQDLTGGGLYKEQYDNGPVNNSEIEFAIGKCEHDGNEIYQHARIIPNLKNVAFELAKSKKQSKKPRIIYMLTLDSVSRRHFYRKLKGVIEFFNTFNEAYPNFAVYDFKLHNILSPSSRGNQVPIFGKKENFVEKFEGYQYTDKLGENAIWNMLRDKGYISSLGFDDCDTFYPKSLGKNPNVDYSAKQFYCYLKAFTLVNNEILSNDVQRCIGPYMYHYYLLNHTHNVIRLNQGVNQWLYVHLNSLTDKTGQHISAMDNDIKEFLEKLLNDFSQDNEIFIFIQASHGNVIESSVSRAEDKMEYQLPAFFLIADKGALKDYPNSFHALEENTKRLTSKLDIRETILALGGIKEQTKNSINLLEEIASLQRTCQDAGIKIEDCSCPVNDFEVDIEVKIDDTEDEIIKHVLAYAQYEINSRSYSSSKYHLGKYCNKLNLEAKSIKEIEDKGKRVVYRINAKNNSRWIKAEFDIDFFIVPKEERIINKDYRYQNTVYEFLPASIQVRNI